MIHLTAEWTPSLVSTVRLFMENIEIILKCNIFNVHFDNKVEIFHGYGSSTKLYLIL